MSPSPVTGFISSSDFYKVGVVTCLELRGKWLWQCKIFNVAVVRRVNQSLFLQYKQFWHEKESCKQLVVILIIVLDHFVQSVCSSTSVQTCETAIIFPSFYKFLGYFSIKVDSV